MKQSRLSSLTKLVASWSLFAQTFKLNIQANTSHYASKWLIWRGFYKVLILSKVHLLKIKRICRNDSYERGVRHFFKKPFLVPLKTIAVKDIAVRCTRPIKIHFLLATFLSFSWRPGLPTPTFFRERIYSAKQASWQKVALMKRASEFFALPSTYSPATGSLALRTQCRSPSRCKLAHTKLDIASWC